MKAVKLTAETLRIMLNHFPEGHVVALVEELRKLHPEFRFEYDDKIHRVNLGSSRPLKHFRKCRAGSKLQGLGTQQISKA